MIVCFFLAHACSKFAFRRWASVFLCLVMELIQNASMGASETNLFEMSDVSAESLTKRFYRPIFYSWGLRILFRNILALIDKRMAIKMFLTDEKKLPLNLPVVKVYGKEFDLECTAVAVVPDPCLSVSSESHWEVVTLRPGH